MLLKIYFRGYINSRLSWIISFIKHKFTSLLTRFSADLRVLCKFYFLNIWNIPDWSTPDLIMFKVGLLQFYDPDNDWLYG